MYICTFGLLNPPPPPHSPSVHRACNFLPECHEFNPFSGKPFFNGWVGISIILLAKIKILGEGLFCATKPSCWRWTLRNQRSLHSFTKESVLRKIFFQIENDCRTKKFLYLKLGGGGGFGILTLPNLEL